MDRESKQAFWDALISAAECANSEGHLEDAEKLFRRAISVAEDQFGRDHVNVAHSWLYFGGFLEQQKRLEEAELAYRKAVKIHQLNNACHLQAMALHSLAQLQWLKGNKEISLKNKEKARRLLLREKD